MKPLSGTLNRFAVSALAVIALLSQFSTLAALARCVTSAAPNGLTLGFSTGGIGGEAVAVDAAGNIYLAGVPRASDFPLVRPLQAQRGGGEDIFVAKLNATGTALIYSPHLGGSGDDSDAAIIVDAASNVYLTGLSHVMATSLATPGAFQPIQENAT